MRTPLAIAVVVATLSAPLGAATAPPAAASPCDHSVSSSTYTGRVFVEDRVNGDYSVYNQAADPVTKKVALGRSVTNTVNRHWEVGAKASGGWGPVKVEISGTYGESYTQAVTKSETHEITMTIRPKHTGWVRAVSYTKVIYWASHTERWSTEKKRCVPQLVSKAYWGAPKIQLVPVTKKGHYYPSRSVAP